MIYYLILRIFNFIIFSLSISNKKARLWIGGRKNWRARLLKECSSDKKWIWFHCASYGEFEDGRIVIEETKRTFSDYAILITFSSPSGYEAKKSYTFADHICYLPLDIPSNASDFIDIVKPVVAIFVRNDIWMNYLKELKSRQIPSLLVAFCMNEHSSFVKWPQHSFYRNAFSMFDTVFVQNNKTNEVLQKNFGLKNIINAGNTRANTICETHSQQHLFPDIEKFVLSDFCIIAGSTLEKDCLIFMKTYSQMQHLKLKWIIVPHEINHIEINKYTASSNRMIKYSDIDKLNANHNLLWLDNVGMLSKIYRYADIAFIGGGFNKIGIHSILEPAVYGCPVAFGPNHRFYVEALDLLDRGGVEIVRNESEFQKFINNYFSNSELLKKIMKENQAYVFEIKGDVAIVIDKIRQLIKK